MDVNQIIEALTHGDSITMDHVAQWLIENWQDSNLGYALQEHGYGIYSNSDLNDFVGG